MISAFPLANIPAEDEALRESVRAFVAQAMHVIPLEQRSRSWMAFNEFSRALAERGWIGLTLPAEYGGGGRTPFARLVVVEELLAAGAPVAAHWIADRQSGPLIVKCGTEQQKRFYLPRISRAEAFFCIGMSEPNADSDLASVRTQAVKTYTGWRLNGSKLWTTNAYRTHYMVALVRTSGSPESRQGGLSQFIIDLSLPGITIRPICDSAGDEHFCEVAFEDVDLDEDSLIGKREVDGSKSWRNSYTNVFAARTAALLGCESASYCPSPLLAAVTKARASEAAVSTAAIAHAVHGAMGITEEYASSYLRDGCTSGVLPLAPNLIGTG